MRSSTAQHTQSPRRLRAHHMLVCLMGRQHIRPLCSAYVGLHTQHQNPLLTSFGGTRRRRELQAEAGRIEAAHTRAEGPAIAIGNSCHALMTRRRVLGDRVRKTDNPGLGPLVYLLELPRARGIPRLGVLLLVARRRRVTLLLRISPRLCAQNTEERVDGQTGGTQEAGASQKATANRLACKAHQVADGAH